MTNTPAPLMPKSDQITDKAIKGMMWIYISTYGGKLLVFFSTIILSRLLTQADYGVADHAIVFISFGFLL